MNESYYNILGVNEKASKDEIKKAYRLQSLKNHPDKNKGDPDAIKRFQSINEAYETLGDEDKRKDYDRMNNNPFFRMSSNSVNEMDIPFHNMEDILNNFFGGGTSFETGGFGPGIKMHVFRGGMPNNFAQSLQKPTPIIKTITLTMEQVLLGATIPLEIERWLVENNTKIFEKETLYITTEKGVDENEIIIMREKGNIINETCRGDVKIFIKIENNTLFERVGLDLHLKKSITLKESLCGFSFEIKYINGNVYTLNNKVGSIIYSGCTKTIQNLGLTRGTHTGNLIIHFNVVYPEKLSLEQINKLSEILE